MTRLKSAYGSGFTGHKYGSPRNRGRQLGMGSVPGMGQTRRARKLNGGTSTTLRPSVKVGIGIGVGAAGYGTYHHFHQPPKPGTHAQQKQISRVGPKTRRGGF